MQRNKNNTFLLLVGLLLAGIGANAQVPKGMVKGLIKEAATNEVIVGASVSLVGTTHGTISDQNGTFLLNGVLSGQYILQVSYVGYSTIRVEDVVVKDGSETILDINLEASGEVMDEVVVTTARHRGSDIALLADQKKASLVIQRIGAQELSRVGASDAAAAVAKMSGISKEEGGTQVYVRGMGDRYNTTSLNGLPLPSNNPRLKNIALDLFSTDVIEFVAVDKVYNSEMSGDFGGGNIDIYSKDYSGNGMLEVSLSSTLNTNAISQADNFMLLANGSKWGRKEYIIPQNPLGGFNFTNSANPISRDPYPANVRLLGGKSFNIGSEGRLNLFATAGFGNGYEYREGVNRDVSAQGARIRWTDQARYGYNTNSTALFNANYRFNTDHKLSYNFLYVNSSEQWNDNYDGYLRDKTEDGTGLRRLGSYAQNRLFVNQLLGTHRLTDRIDVDWGASVNKVGYIMPDRIENTLLRRNENEFVVVQTDDTDNNRFNMRLDEQEYAINLNGSYRIGQAESPKGMLRLGYQGRYKKRGFEAIQFNFDHTSTGRSVVLNPNNLDALYNPQSYGQLFTVVAFSGARPQKYNGDQQIHAGYVSLEYDVTDRLTSVVGVRYENIQQKVDWLTVFYPNGDSNMLTKNPLLPSLNLKYELNEKQNIRFGASKTYTLPQFKERAPFVYDDGSNPEQGNAFLYPSDNYNVDLKWEMFPSSSELLTVAAFGKYIQNPINEINIAATANDISWVNIGDVGTAFGMELEAKKDLVHFNQERDLLSAGLNVAYMYTDQKIDVEKVRRETVFDIRPTFNESTFTGASDLLVNADLTYVKRWRNDSNVTATVAYSYFSDKVFALGNEQKGNLVDKGVSMLDFIVRSKVSRRVGANLVVRNILDPEYRRIQENAGGHVPVLTYRKGRFFTLGLTYQL